MERFGELSEPSRRVRLSDLEAAVEPWFAGIPADLQLVAARGFVAELLGVEEDEELRNLAPWKVAATLVEIHGLDGAKFDDILATGKWREMVPPPCLQPSDQQRPTATEQLLLQQQHQIQMQQQQQADMMAMLMRMQRQLQALEGKQDRPYTPQPGATSAACDALPFPPADPPARSPKVALYPEDATDVREWQAAMESDVARLVSDLRHKYMGGLQSEALVGAFERLRDWVHGVAQGGGWVENPEIVRLGNSLFQEVQFQYYWNVKHIPRAQLMRERRYSAHSVKRGAVDHLMAAKAGGAPFPAHLISRLAKHANEVDPTVSDMTIRYTTDSVALARVLQTGEAHGIAQRGRGPNGLLNVPFTVVEEKEGALRQRFILWTYDANAVVETDGYQAHVPLQHVSQYLEAVSEECGSTRDFRCGFYGIEIPIASRGLFAFQDDAGEWWELTRLPMGHSCAPELMHTVASTAAGHPEYVDGQYAVSSDVVVHVWVDNIRYAGPHDLVLAVTSRLDELASEAGMTWKAADTQTAAQRYEFIGVEWNHADGTVGVSRKMRSRLQRAEDAIEGGSMTASDVESLAGRLLHASAITGVFVGEFYFVLKFFRRVTNALNRGEKAVDEKVVLSDGIRRSLPVWLRRVARRRAVPVAAQTPELAVFVDASLDGWGGVLVDVDTNDMVVVGARWKRAERRFHINELEAMALERSVAAITPAHAGSTGGKTT
ncbi:hypothetical protein DIPPA_22446 [Diplonema papillatum]|nr:hypothetical protein DIPPA_22446 [Diplonema papillatum]